MSEQETYTIGIPHDFFKDLAKTLTKCNGEETRVVYHNKIFAHKIVLKII